MDVTTAAAIAFAVVLAGVVAFQVALALGAPWGAYAMAGAFPGRYPPAMRVAALGQGVVLALVGLVVLSAARLVLPELAEGLPWLIWVAVAISGASLVLNVITPNASERRIWVPVALAMLACSLTVAITA
jgi:hypothetical protein